MGPRGKLASGKERDECDVCVCAPTFVLDAQTQNGDEPVGEITSFLGQSCLSSANSC